MERTLLRGLAVFRWAAWGWMAFVLVLARRRLDVPAAAFGLVVAAMVVTVGATVLLRRRPGVLLEPAAVGAELAVGVALLAADGWVYEPGHVFSDQQSLGVAWPLAGVLAAGVALGPWAGVAAGALLGTARAVSSLIWLDGGVDPARQLSLVTTGFLYALAGGAAGYLTRLLRRAEHEVATARAREEVARTLHDGVLQTLALVERRTDDTALARLARDQERDLRRFLFGSPVGGAVGSGGLGDELRRSASRYETAFGGRVEVLVPDDLPPLPDDRRQALLGAVGEALTNAGKHGRAARVTVYLEPDGAGVFCSVKDDGVGFDPAAVDEGVGLSRSIRARVAEAGGRVEVEARPGRGVEVRLWL